jgi:hypothetical protein
MPDVWGFALVHKGSESSSLTHDLTTPHSHNNKPNQQSILRPARESKSILRTRVDNCKHAFKIQCIFLRGSDEQPNLDTSFSCSFHVKETPFLEWINWKHEYFRETALQRGSRGRPADVVELITE